MAGREPFGSCGSAGELLRDEVPTKAPPFVVASRSLGHGLVRRLTRQRHDGGFLSPPQPPECPPGSRTGPPDFVGVGGQRCGTTRWFRLLASHPEVACSPTAKGAALLRPLSPGRLRRRGRPALLRALPPAGGETGEWTPLYGNSPWVPPLLARVAPEARILMLVRDPLDRYLSGLQHNARLAREQGLRLSTLAPVEAFARGLYHAHCGCCSPTSIARRSSSSSTSAACASRSGSLRRTFEFIGLRDTGFTPPGLEANPNHQPSKPRLDPVTAEAYVNAYRADVLRLVEAFPELDLRLWSNFAELAR